MINRSRFIIEEYNLEIEFLEQKKKIKKKNVHKNAADLDNSMLAIYFNGYSNITDKKRKRWLKTTILVINVLKIINMINGTKKIKKKSGHSRKKLLLKELN